ncbi:hypothetical protein ASD15_26600 [Massilia sp. Root351]|jgi:uncharacterized protein (DUF427 family)|uniref:DUF427 domain-containing protein n=1 Tax=Massilia sp. Root351 TaxID=1736522 RepID=UPI00070BEEB0|nr:DUF427 domain-containing protein [Massilia sp. Root351]KQV88656.1 hypothetical protein ASD15_26600 [Massilia sp. Root351]
MPKAIWNGEVIAEANDDEVQIVENNVYFPIGKVNEEYLQDSVHTTTCPWKGTANYYHLVVDGKVNEDAAWFYRHPSDKAQHIKDHIAFWHGVEVQR